MPQVHVDECDVDLRVARGGQGFPERPGHAGDTVSPILKVARGLQRDQRLVLDDEDAESVGAGRIARHRLHFTNLLTVRPRLPAAYSGDRSPPERDPPAGSRFVPESLQISPTPKRKTVVSGTSGS